MKAAIYDTYVVSPENNLMHFDIVVAEGETFENVIDYGKSYLKERNLEKSKITSEECKFCHIEKADPQIEKAINTHGYYIIEMEGC